MRGGAQHDRQLRGAVTHLSPRCRGLLGSEHSCSPFSLMHRYELARGAQSLHALFLRALVAAGGWRALLLQSEPPAAATAANVHFCIRWGGLCILSRVAILLTQQGKRGERTNRSRGALAVSAVWPGLGSAARPLPLPHVLPLGDPPPPCSQLPRPRGRRRCLSSHLPRCSFRCGACEHTRLAAARGSTDRPRAAAICCASPGQSTPGRRGAARVHTPALPCASGGSSSVPSSSSSSSPGTQRGSSDAAQHAGSAFQLTAPFIPGAG